MFGYLVMHKGPEHYELFFLNVLCHLFNCHAVVSV